MTTWEDFTPGDVYVSNGLTVTETHVVNFAGLTGDNYYLHTDEEAAKRTPFGTRVAHGPLVYAFSFGQMAQANIYQDAILAFMGADNVRHLAPCWIGATIKTQAQVLSAVPTRSGSRGIVTMRYTVSDADETVLMTAELKFLMRSRNAAQAVAVRGDQDSGQLAAVLDR